jgi:alpha-ketoglutarate-dependent taurine dioxygenase
MTNEQREQTDFGRFKNLRRKAVNLSQEELVKSEYLQTGQDLPLVMRPAVENVDAAFWARNNREMIEAQLAKHGAILFRGFDLDGVGKFEDFARAVSPELLDYRERSSPRSEISRGVYTSTDHPPEESIHFHNEQSYTRSWPMKLWFYCDLPAERGGATPIADGRKVLRQLDPKVSEKFTQKRVMYMRNYGDGLGLDWRTAFQTDSRAAVEAYCRKSSIEFEWKDGDRLRTRQVFDTIVRHPRTGELVWFEHTAFFHITSLAPDVRDSITSMFEEEDLPFNTYYGDGSPIEDSVLEEIRGAYRQVGVSFPWRKSDLLLIDNMLTSHSRESYSGARRILVAMAELYSPAA